MAKELEVVWTLRAEIHLDEIYRHLEDMTEGSGEFFLDEIGQVLGLIQEFPLIGREFAPPVRRRVIWRGRYGLFYSPEDRGIIVIGVLDLRQDPRLIKRLLGLLA